MRQAIIGVCLVTVVTIGFSGVSSAQTSETILRYSFSDSTVLPVVTDQSSAGNHATAGPLAALSTDVPLVGSSFGNRSLDTSNPAADFANLSGAQTDAMGLLHNTQVTANGGFAMECWFKWNGGTVLQTVLDYAGTEKIVVEPDGDVFVMISDFLFSMQIGTVGVGEWHYVAVVFDTQLAPLNPDGTQDGVLTAYLDDTVPVGAPLPVTKSNFGDNLNRPIAVGMHSTGGFSEFFNGLVFEPRVTLGPLSATELLLDPAVLGFDMQLNGGAAVVGDVLEVTPCCDFGVAGSAFITTPYDMSMSSMEIAFSFVMTPFIGAADGITLTIQNSAAGAGALGDSHHFLGYGGIGAIENSVAIEFDCWANTFDPAGYGQGFDHIGYNVGGDVEAGVGVLTAPLELNDGTLRYVWINYDAGLGTLDVYFSDANVKPATPLLSQAGVDLETLVGPTGYIGFTASTGGSSQSHEIHSLTIDVASGTPYVRGDCNGDGALNIADAIAMLGILFSGGATTCLDACDSNGSAAFDIADPIHELGFLFSSGAAPPAPFPECGIAEALGCDSFNCSK